MVRICCPTVYLVLVPGSYTQDIALRSRVGQLARTYAYLSWMRNIVGTFIGCVLIMSLGRNNGEDNYPHTRSIDLDLWLFYVSYHTTRF